MKVLLALALLLAAAPLADAHPCNGSGCGPCTEGENHAHNGPEGQCASSAGGSAQNSPTGQSATPLGAVVALAGLAVAALALGRR